MYDLNESEKIETDEADVLSKQENKTRVWEGRNLHV